MTDEITKTGEIDPKLYLEYLDKEMTIMSVLSTVTVLATGGILSSLLSSDKCIARDVWANSYSLILAGAILCTLAATFFYKQRSDLAWHYGQICLRASRKDSNVTEDIRSLLKKADAWDSWYPYSWGWTCLVGDLIAYGTSLVSYMWLPETLSGSQLNWVSGLVIAVGVIITLVTCRLQYYALTRYKNDDDYWASFEQESNFWAGLRRKKYWTRFLTMLGKLVKLP